MSEEIWSVLSISVSSFFLTTSAVLHSAKLCTWVENQAWCSVWHSWCPFLSLSVSYSHFSCKKRSWDSDQKSFVLRVQRRGRKTPPNIPVLILKIVVGFFQRVKLLFVVFGNQVVPSIRREPNTLDFLSLRMKKSEIKEDKVMSKKAVSLKPFTLSVSPSLTSHLRNSSRGNRRKTADSTASFILTLQEDSHLFFPKERNKNAALTRFSTKML